MSSFAVWIEGALVVHAAGAAPAQALVDADVAELPYECPADPRMVQYNA